MVNSNPSNAKVDAAKRVTGLRAVDLFSGPGGLALGFKEAGTEVIAAVEFNRHAFATYSLHTKPHFHFNGDVASVDLKPFRGKAEMVFGGPPCQPFSLGGLNRGSSDKRDMIPQFIRAVEEIEPVGFLMENVVGLSLKAHANYLNDALIKMRRLGYQLAWRVVNAAEYGVPQKRRRLIVVGFRQGLFEFPPPSHGLNCNLPLVPSGAVVGLEGFGQSPLCPVKFAKTPDLRPSPYHGHLYNGGGRPLDLGQPAPTILASSGGYKTHWIDTEGVAPRYHAHLLAGGTPWTGEVPGARRLSVEECAAIQTFPRGMQFMGPRSAQYTQVGDAVPPLLAASLAKAMVSQLLASTKFKQSRANPQLIQGSLF